jgi:hypothetical protein
MRTLMLSASIALATAAACLAAPAPAHAIAEPGTVAPEFVKNEVVGGATGPAWSLGAHRGKIVVLFVMGYG